MARWDDVYAAAAPPTREGFYEFHDMQKYWHSSSTRSEAEMSEDPSVERASDEENGPGETRPDEQLVGDDESEYGGAGADDGQAGVRDQSGNSQNRPPSERDDDQAI